MKITEELIESGKTGNGGWSKAQLACLEISWPPPKGWKSSVIGKEISPQLAQLFVAGKGKPLHPDKRKDPNAPKEIIMGVTLNPKVHSCERNCDTPPWEVCHECPMADEQRAWKAPDLTPTEMQFDLWE